MYPYSLGVQKMEENAKKGIRVAFASAEAECGIVFYDRKTGEEVSRHAFDREKRVGKVYLDTIPHIDRKKYSYLFYEGDKLVVDKTAVRFDGKDEFGVRKSVADYKAVIEDEVYHWGEDCVPQIPYEDCVCYCLHVRGFTKHKTSGVKAKGTFAGIVEKLPYLKELGITTLELQPAYEFNELTEETFGWGKTPLIVKRPVLNYWGYQEGFYYAPKRAYAKSENAGREFKDMVKALHENRMEVVMQFYFPETVSSTEIVNILRFWHMEYHVDGFHVKGQHLPLKELVKDPYLAECKLWNSDLPLLQSVGQHAEVEQCHVALYKEDYRKTIRRFLKGDTGILYDVMYCMRRKPANSGFLNYISNYDGFTMADMVTYEKKHNEANGEENRDGTDVNYSWNWGKEGPTRKKQVQQIRQQQVKNAFALLMLSQGTPLFFMGDEIGNSQGGNNNPYCQDNDVTWLNWRDLAKNKELQDWVKEVIAFRKSNRVFRQKKECRLSDYLEVGVPDLSYHGTEAWLQKWEYGDRHVGMMLSGEYASGCEGKLYYLAINMYWEAREFGLPKLSEEQQWKVALTTVAEDADELAEIREGILVVPARSIVLLLGE